MTQKKEFSCGTTVTVRTFREAAAPGVVVGPIDGIVIHIVEGSDVPGLFYIGDDKLHEVRELHIAVRDCNVAAMLQFIESVWKERDDAGG